jgi:hypothetical protein
MYTSNIFFGDKVIIEVYGSTVNKTFTVCSQIQKETIQYTSPPFTDTNSVICKIIVGEKRPPLGKGALYAAEKEKDI